MRRLKIFTDTDTERLEITINEWLTMRSVQIWQVYQSESAESPNAKAHITITIIYISRN